MEQNKDTEKIDHEESLSQENDDYILRLDGRDMCAILCIDGDFVEIIAHDYMECIERADDIKNWMSKIFEDDARCHDGLWIFRIDESCEKAKLEYIGES